MFFRWILCLSMLALVSCASRPPAYKEQGWASYVADQYTGRPTSSGEIYYPQAYTAAHTSLPFGTVVTVKNIMNGRTVNVTINDRFPHYPGRVINLSSVAAQHIGIPYMQMGQVEVVAKTVAGGAYGQQPAPASGGYQPQPAYQPQPNYSGTYTPQPAATYPSYTPPPAASPGYQVQPPAGGAPNAPGYSGGGAPPPPGLKTF